MNRAQFYLWSVLHNGEHLDDAALSELATQAVGQLHYADPQERRSDMENAVGAWAERSDLPDSYRYISNLRQADRWERLAGK